MQALAGPYATWWDKVRGKTSGWGREEHKKAGFRMVPNGVVRHGSFIAKNVVLMPSFVNIGDTIKEGDTLCIIEAMKLFNEIESEVSGKIVKVLVDDTTPIEFDQPLFLVDPS